MICSCAVGPDYRKPDAGDLAPKEWTWKVAEPKDAIPKGEWWKIFNDPLLDQLETVAVTNNQNLRSAIARVDEARAAARISRSRFFPELSLEPSYIRERTSANQPTFIPIAPPLELTPATLNTFSLPLDLSYEVDLWGRIRRSFESATAQAEASVADYQNVVLTLTADVAADYFLIRSLDSEIAALQRIAELHEVSIRILNERLIAGSIAEGAVVKAKTELSNVRADLADTALRRAEAFNALALLCGKHAGSLEIDRSPLNSSPPAVRAGIPSSLLERRPDIARAERALAAKNAEIGVAVAGYFPSIALTGQVGYLSKSVSNLFSGDSRVWSLGPAVSLPLFNAGRTAAEVRQAEASYQETLADYRQTVLSAFKDVEDSLAQIVLRNEQAIAQKEAYSSTKRLAELTGAQYEAGAVSLLELAEAQRGMLAQSRAGAQVQGLRFVACVRLIKALGGGWEP